MLITLNPNDENGLLAGLDFALTALAFEQQINIVFLFATEAQKITLNPALISKLETLLEMGAGDIHHLESRNVQNIPKNLHSEVLSASEYSSMAKSSHSIVSF